MDNHQTHPRQGRRFAVLLVLFSFLFFAPVAAQSGSTRYVAPAGTDTANTCLSARNPCATVGHAVSQADPDDTIRMSPGVYTETNIHVEESLTITGQQASNTILQGAASMEEAIDPVLIIGLEDWELGVTVTLQNLTIRHGSNPPGFFVEGAITVLPTSAYASPPTSLTLVYVVVEANQGNGIGMGDAAILVLHHSQVSQNQGDGIVGHSADISILENSEIAANSGDGVHCSYGCDIGITWSVIQGNKDGIDGGEGAFIQVSNSQILNNSGWSILAELGEVNVADSLVSGNGGGLAVQNDVDITVIHSVIRNNQNDGIYNNDGVTEVYNTIIANNQGDGIYHGNNNWDLDVRDSTIRDNNGYGLYLFQTGGSVFSTTISGNQKGGLYLEYDAGLSIYDSSIVRNRSNLNGGGIFNQGDLMLVNTLVSQNRAAQHGGGIYSDPGNWPELHNLQLIGVTVTQNYADTLRNNTGNGGGIYSPVWDDVTLQNTILTDNYDLSPTERHPNCSGGLTSLGGNTFGDLTGCTVIEE